VAFALVDVDVHLALPNTGRRWKEMISGSKMVIAKLSAFLACFGAAAGAVGQMVDLVELQLVAEPGFNNAVFVCGAPGEPANRLFALDKVGRLRVMTGQTTQVPPVLDLSAVVDSSSNERGLLGLAFDPQYALNRRFYLFYSDRSSGSVIARYQMNPVLAGQPITADPASALLILRIPATASIHNGGCIRFGPDGLLYVGVGDAGLSSRAPDPAYLTGKLLRIDVNGDDFPNDPNRNYRIPNDNPTTWPSTTAGQTVTGLPEIWAVGFRNPWRWSFDRLTGDLCIGDVGASTWEEVNIVSGNGGPGRNYGWPAFEGFSGQSPSTNPEYNARLTPPVYVYPHPTSVAYPPDFRGYAVLGGFVYRGNSIPGWRGRYVFADNSIKLWSLRMQNGVATDVQAHTSQFTFPYLRGSLSSLGEDNNGEIYVTALDSPLLRIVPSALSNSLSIADIARSGGLPGPDGIVDGSDFITFINAFMAEDLVADVVNSAGTRPPDDVVDAADFIAFVTAFAARR
jgi:glucose/arabinose dehydrogenase